MKRIVHFAYFVIKTDYADLWCSLNCVAKSMGGRVRYLSDMLFCSLCYGTSFVDYFNFRLFEKSRALRRGYAGMGFMHRFHLAMNAPDFVDEVDDKAKFFRNFSKFTYSSYNLANGATPPFADWLGSIGADAIVVKDPTGTTGKGVEFFDLKTESSGKVLISGYASIEEFIAASRRRGLVHVEPRLTQHQVLADLSPKSINTIRVITIVNRSGQPEIIGSILRIGWNSRVDNFSAGNLSAEVDIQSGTVVTGAIQKRAACSPYYEKHPVTGSRILGLKVPYWDSIVEMCKSAALVFPQVRTVGWDVAVTNDGPVLIEGNPKWNKDTWQIPANRGKKNVLLKFLQEEKQ